MIQRLDWLHISDFHFVASTDEFSQDVASEALIRDIKARIVESRNLSFVLVSGDVAFSGQREEYERAAKFFTRLVAAVGVPPNRFFFVPGNHDVDRKKQGLAFRGACVELRSQPQVDLVLGNPDDLEPLIERQAAFKKFFLEFSRDQVRQQTDEGLAYVTSLDLDGFRMCIIGLNSAWLSGRDAEEMKLVIGERQIIRALQLAQASRPQLIIAMAHHPISWLQEWDQTSCHHQLLPGVHFYHRGHLHTAEVSLSSSPDRPCLSIAAGSGHATRFYENSYNLVGLDLGSGVCAVRPFRYDPKLGSYEERQQIDAPIFLQGLLPGTELDLADAFAAESPSSAPYSDYFGGLILGSKDEVPALVNGNVEFLTPSIAQVVLPKEETAVGDFLKLRNLLRLYDEDITLAQRVREHATTAENFAEYVADLAKRDTVCAERVMNRGNPTTSQLIEGTSYRLPRTVEFLEDLRHHGQWETLETQARKLVDDPDEVMSRLAKRLLAEAMMHSDQTEKRAEALSLATELTRDSRASASDFLLAGGTSEVLGDDHSAIEFATKAVTNWPTDQEVRNYARGLALRTGDPALRAAVEASSSQGTGS